MWLEMKWKKVTETPEKYISEEQDFPGSVKFFIKEDLMIINGFTEEWKSNELQPTAESGG